jgi:hypothetical protein
MATQKKVVRFMNVQWERQNPPAHITIPLRDDEELKLLNPASMAGGRYHISFLRTRKIVKKETVSGRIERYLWPAFLILGLLAVICGLMWPWVKVTRGCGACELAPEEIEFEYCLYKFFWKLKGCVDGNATARNGPA